MSSTWSIARTQEIRRGAVSRMWKEPAAQGWGRVIQGGVGWYREAG